MKSNQKNNFFRNRAPVQKTSGPSSVNKNKDELVVIRDVSTNKEYFLSIVDTFMYAEHEYVVMYNYVPDDGNHEKPELVIMRTEFTSKGDQLFYSIRDNNELEVAFSVFMRRYYDSDVPNKKLRRGVL
ncbi:MAG: DUF1292 domain-containing protein [Saccharofermentans sp.]|nr:DUF1292 domain-containing protein [Saccharofermentans sp.]